MLLEPLGLELGRGEIPQRGRDSFVHIDCNEKARELAASVMVDETLGQVNLLPQFPVLHLHPSRLHIFQRMRRQTVQPIFSLPYLYYRLNGRVDRSSADTVQVAHAAAFEDSSSNQLTGQATGHCDAAADN